MQLPTGQFSQLANMLVFGEDPGAHGMNTGKAKQNDWTGARTLRRAVGMAGKVAAGTQPAEQALQANTAGGPSARHRP